MIRRLVLVALVLFPSVAVAQRGRTQADRKTPLFDKEEMPKGPVLRVRDIEDLSPLRLLADKRKDLKLSDTQLSQVKEAEEKLKEKNAILLKPVESLVRDMRTNNPNPSEQERERVRSARNGLIDVLKSVTDNNDASAAEVLALLDPEQQAKAKELLQKQRQDGDKMLRDKLSGGQRP